MSRWVRFAQTYAQARRKPRLGFNDSWTVSFRVWPTECDAAFLNHTSWFVYAESARLEFMVRTGFFSWAKNRKLYLPTTSVSGQFRRSVRRFDVVELENRVATWDDESIWTEHRAYVDGKLAAVLTQRGTARRGRDKLSALEVIDELSPGAKPAVLAPWMEGLRDAHSACRDEVPNDGVRGDSP